jgi:hypothetical protein
LQQELNSNFSPKSVLTTVYPLVSALKRWSDILVSLKL